MISNIPISAQGLAGAPWNDREMSCPHCDGGGEWFIRYDEEDNEIRLGWREWRKLTPEQQSEWEREQCPHCDGYGTIWK